MCGILGILRAGNNKEFNIQLTVERMLKTISHRGPDDGGIWVNASQAVALGHRRLSIVDISSAGHQPMLSKCGRFVLSFNGEIYNHRELRAELNKSDPINNNLIWRGTSDTETLLAAIAKWGLEKAINKIIGMFAFALWDQQLSSLYLVRDRIGEKPMYYCQQNGLLFFGSELKAIRTFPGFEPVIDRDALAIFLQKNFIPAPYTIYSNVKKLPAGTFLKIDLKDLAKGVHPSPLAYWKLSEVVAYGQHEGLYKGNITQATSSLDKLLQQVISSQMLADVPVGAFLSGGIDSSLVAAIMQSQSRNPIDTFTIGFNEANYSEAKQAHLIASFLGANHHELIVDPEKAISAIAKMPAIYDEPFADVSQIPTFLLSEFSRRSVKVCLSGDGGDEFFGGYNRYIYGAHLWKKFRYIPINVRTKLVNFIRARALSELEFFGEGLGKVIPSLKEHKMLGNHILKFAEIIEAISPEDLYDRLTSNTNDVASLVNGVDPTKYLPEYNLGKSNFLNVEHFMMNLDANFYLPDNILVKVDRAAMANSLETRMPMLDQRVLEFAWTIPFDMKIRGKSGKVLLRKLLERYIPASLTNRPKSGFSMPIGEWLRGPLKHWAEGLLEESSLLQQGYLNPKMVLEKWGEHIRGERNWSREIWAILMFQQWLQVHESKNFNLGRE